MIRQPTAAAVRDATERYKVSVAGKRYIAIASIGDGERFDVIDQGANQPHRVTLCSTRDEFAKRIVDALNYQDISSALNGGKQ